jgi:hypothetical protein
VIVVIVLMGRLQRHCLQDFSVVGLGSSPTAPAKLLLQEFIPLAGNFSAFSVISALKAFGDADEN